MKNVGKFHKVSFNQFSNDIAQNSDIYNIINKQMSRNGISVYDNEAYDKYVRELYDNIKLPSRSTSRSAGYDFWFPYPDLTIFQGQSIVIPTGIKVEIIDEWFLADFPKSGLGFEYRISMDNTVGIIDGDYYDNINNEGHIKVKLHNGDLYNRPVTIEYGKSYFQGIFLQFGLTEDDNANGIRTGGFGSTDKK